MSARQVQTRRRSGRQVTIGQILVFAFLIVHLTVVIFPFIWMIYSSLKTNQEFLASVWSLPEQPVIENYSVAIADGNLLVYARNSLIVTLATVFFTVIVSTCAGYAMSFFRRRWTPIVEILMIVCMAIPAYAIIVPLVGILRQSGLGDNFLGVILPTVAFNLPVTTILMRAFFDGVPRGLAEAAYVDGASELSVFVRVMMPIASPAMFTAAIINVIWVWNDFLLPLVLLDSPSRKTLPIGLTDFVGDRMTDYPVLMAAIFLASLGSLIIYIFFQRKVIGGLTGGALKG